MNTSFFKTAVYTLCIICAFSQCHTPSDETSNLPARWIFTERNTILYASGWTGDEHFAGAMSGSSARIEAVRKNGGNDFTYTDRNGAPFVSTLTEDDYILFTVPSVDLDKGSHVEIDAAIVSNPASPKYFIIEYLEGGKWKSVADDLLSVPENPELKYSFMCSGIGEGEPHEYSSVFQTIPLSKAVRNGDLKIRFRAVGNFTCSGAPQNPHAEDGATGFVSYGFTGAYIQNYGTSVPADTTDILCIGNSFTYYSNAPSMLKEIAWSQGHYFNIKAALKGGQTLGQHTRRILTNKLAKDGGYDVVFLQDQSQTPARYAADPANHENVLEDYKTISDIVLTGSPDCRLVMEQTWAYPSQRFGGFNDFATFTRLLEEGATGMARVNGAAVSPIGNAFETVYNENRSIRLFDTDNKHQSHYGTYLKACVNYLLITGKAFSGKPADCGLEPEKAEYLRSVAERTVLGR